MWQCIGHTDFVCKQEWPKVVESEMNGGTKEFPVQVNGRVKFCVTVEADETPEKILEIVKADSRVKEIFETNEVLKEIYVKNKILNIVVKK